MFELSDAGKMTRSFLEKHKIHYCENVVLSHISSVKIGGVCRLVAYPEYEGDMVLLLRFLNQIGVAYLVFGGATNLLFGDGVLDTILICTRRMANMTMEDGLLTVESGSMLFGALNFALKRGFGGAEELFGIPGTVGGAICGNAGAFGKSIGDFVTEVRVYSPYEDKIITVAPPDCDFSYRASRFMCRGDVVLSAKLSLNDIDIDEAKEKIGRFRTWRKATQPTEKPSLGSVFKRVNNCSAGELIDKCGLKGHKIGGASISEKHAGFIVNNGEATASDFIALCYLAKKCVFEKYHLVLEPEVKFLIN